MDLFFKNLFGNKIYVSPFWIKDVGETVDNLYSYNIGLGYIESNDLFRLSTLRTHFNRDTLIKEKESRGITTRVLLSEDSNSTSYRVSFIKNEIYESSIYVLVSLSKLYLKSVLKVSYDTLNEGLVGRESYLVDTLYRESMIRDLLKDPFFIQNCLTDENRRRNKNKNHYGFNPDLEPGLFKANFDREVDLDLINFLRHNSN